LEGQQLTDFNGFTLSPIVGSHVVNSAPVITNSSDTGTVAENADITTVIYTATATDADNDQITWDLAGRDEQLLQISSSGEVTLIASADFESDQENYQFDVIADDGTAVETKSVTVTVTNDTADDAPDQGPVFEISSVKYLVTGNDNDGNYKFYPITDDNNDGTWVVGAEDTSGITGFTFNGSTAVGQLADDGSFTATGGGGGATISYVPLEWNHDSDDGTTADIGLVIDGKPIMLKAIDGTATTEQFVQKDSNWVAIEPITPATGLTVADINNLGDGSDVFPATGGNNNQPAAPDHGPVFEISSVKYLVTGTDASSDYKFYPITDDDNNGTWVVGSEVTGITEFTFSGNNSVGRLASDGKFYAYIETKMPQGYEIYADENTDVLHVLLKEQGNTLVPITNNAGTTFTDPSLLPPNVNDWYTLDNDGDGSPDDVTLDTPQTGGGVVDKTPEWTPNINIDGRPTFQDDNTASDTSRLIATEVGSGGSSVKVVITDSTGQITYNDIANVPTDSELWYTEDPSSPGTFIKIPFTADNIIPVDDMVNLMKGIYNAEDIDPNTEGVQLLDAQLPSLKALLVGAAIDGDLGSGGSIQGLEALTGLDADVDDVDPNTDGVQTIQSIVSKHIDDGMVEIGNQTGSVGDRTIDEIFKEAVDDTIVELETYNSDIFSS
jgi:hypothetical protein